MQMASNGYEGPPIEPQADLRAEIEELLREEMEKIKPPEDTIYHDDPNVDFYNRHVEHGIMHALQYVLPDKVQFRIAGPAYGRNADKIIGVEFNINDVPLPDRREELLSELKKLQQHFSGIVSSVGKKGIDAVYKKHALRAVQMTENEISGKSNIVCSGLVLRHRPVGFVSTLSTP